MAVTIDEIENGVYYKNHILIWKMIIEAAKGNNSQIFVTTHSRECLRGLIGAAGEDIGDIALWRLEHDEGGQPELLQFDGDELASAIELDLEVRGGVSILDD
jgi:AAA15 family ATPase/GTPase